MTRDDRTALLAVLAWCAAFWASLALVLKTFI